MKGLELVAGMGVPPRLGHHVAIGTWFCDTKHFTETGQLLGVFHMFDDSAAYKSIKGVVCKGDVVGPSLDAVRPDSVFWVGIYVNGLTVAFLIEDFAKFSISPPNIQNLPTPKFDEFLKILDKYFRKIGAHLLIVVFVKTVEMEEPKHLVVLE
jgi:hypothetical protein